MVTKYLGENGVTQLITLIKNTFVQKALKTGSTTNYKELTDNNLTDTMRGQYDTAYTHSKSEHAPSNAQANIIEAVKVNGTALTPSEKAVNIPVPLISTDISTDSKTDLKTASPKAVATYVASAIAGITGMSFKILEKGEYDPTSGIPTITGAAGYIYLVPISSDEASNNYNEFIYINDTFEKIGTTAVDMSGYLKTTDIAGYTATEVDNIWATVFSA